MSAAGRRTFPLVPRRRLTGLPFGDLATRRRGRGGDVIAHRRYATGDPVSSIDWYASARLSAASGRDDFVVRQHAVDEAPRVVIVADRRPAMGLYPEGLPWLSKRDAVREAAAGIAASAVAARADLALLDFGDGDASWLPPARRADAAALDEHGFDAPDDTVERSLELLLGHRRELPPGTFVFVLSDFLDGIAVEAWERARAHGWELVPVVVQDPVWESSFPAVAGVAVEVADPRGGSSEVVRLGRRQTRRRRDEHEQRHARLVDDFLYLGLRTVTLETSDPVAIDDAFVEWAEDRRRSW